MSGRRVSFRAIRDEMARRIGQREWAPGALIPAEEALAREFGAARATVNRALQELARSGLIERKRKAGTRVVPHPVREARFAIPLVRQEIEARGQTYHYRLLSRAEEGLPEAVAARMKLKTGSVRLHVRALHLADGAPYQYEDRWINTGAVPGARAESFEVVSPNEWLVAKAPFSEADLTVFADAATEEEARLLNVASGAPVFVVERLTWLVEKPITLVRMVHPGTHRMVSRL